MFFLTYKYGNVNNAKNFDVKHGLRNQALALILVHEIGVA